MEMDVISHFSSCLSKFNLELDMSLFGWLDVPARRKRLMKFFPSGPRRPARGNTEHLKRDLVQENATHHLSRVQGNNDTETRTNSP